MELDLKTSKVTPSSEFLADSCHVGREFIQTIPYAKMATWIAMAAFKNAIFFNFAFMTLIWVESIHEPCNVTIL